MRKFFDQDGNEIDPEDLGIYEEEASEQPEGLNRADLGVILILPWLGFANGVAAATNYLHAALVDASVKIDARKRFAREAGMVIEAITGGDEGV